MLLFIGYFFVLFIGLWCTISSSEGVIVGFFSALFVVISTALLISVVFGLLFGGGAMIAGSKDGGKVFLFSVIAIMIIAVPIGYKSFASSWKIRSSAQIEAKRRAIAAGFPFLSDAPKADGDYSGFSLNIDERIKRGRLLKEVFGPDVIDLDADLNTDKITDPRYIQYVRNRYKVFG